MNIETAIAIARKNLAEKNGLYYDPRGGEMIETTDEARAYNVLAKFSQVIPHLKALTSESFRFFEGN